MAEEQGISTWRTSALERLTQHRRAGQQQSADAILAELREVHIALGERRTGTVEEQRTYLLARSTSTPLPELYAAGVNTNAWPVPPRSSPARPDSAPLSPAAEERITNLFESAGPIGDPAPRDNRYQARHRPQDGQVFQQRPLHWAVWDTDLDIAIAYLPVQELAEYQADNASSRYANRHRRAS
ncbi:hypothetical protein HFP70_35600 [Streptomyces sp. ARC14]|uniref:hypothetical protein n=1 Tax=Streptomyces sp. ARC14 TaxID=2724152 RepID=UPI00385774BC